VSTFKSGKNHTTARTISRLRRLQKLKRIADGSRPKNCVRALNGALEAAAKSADVELRSRFHPTKGWRAA